MPATVVLVQTDPEFAALVGAALVAGGYSVAYFHGASVTLDAIDRGMKCRILVTQVDFGLGHQHGISLARMALMKRPALRVLFTCELEHEAAAREVGEVLITPTQVDEIVAAVSRMVLLGASETVVGSETAR